MRHARLAMVIAPAILAACKSDGGTGLQASYLGAWEGMTTQGHAVQFHVENDGIHIAAIRFTINGATCTTTVTVYLTREPPDGPFQVSGTDLAINTAGSSGVVALTGSFSAATTASGMLHATSIPCDGAIDVPWSATKASAAGSGFTGTWTGDLSSTAISPTPATIIIGQSGATLAGVFSMTNGATGTFSGTVSGNLGTFTITETTPGCAGTFTGHALKRDDGAGPRLFVGYSGSDCLGAHQRGGGILMPAP
jgi:hypothetical protein